MASLQHYLLLNHIKIENANAISSPLTYGFPSIAGFLGAIHQLNRHIGAIKNIYLDGVLIACHQCDVQVYRPHDFADYTFCLTRNPLDKNGDVKSIIQEGRVHLDVSLLIEVKIDDPFLLDDENQKIAFAKQIKQSLYQHRMAGGNITSIEKVEFHSATSSTEDLTRLLFPAFVLIESQQDLVEITQQLQQKDPSATELDALIETAILHRIPPTENNEQWQTCSIKTGRGWLVPLHFGYQAISPLFSEKHFSDLRSDQYASQFVEAIYGLGKWVFPTNLGNNFKDAFWRYQTYQPLENNDIDIYLINRKTNY